MHITTPLTMTSMHTPKIKAALERMSGAFKGRLEGHYQHEVSA
jgi:hypothetical protein